MVTTSAPVTVHPHPAPRRSGLLLAGLLVSQLAAATVNVQVYYDTDGNGRQDAGEAGVPSVLVSDGERVQLTDPGGRTEFIGEPGTAGGRLFVIVPGGHRATTPWHQRLSAGAAARVSFGLQPATPRGEAELAVTGGFATAPGEVPAAAAALLADLAPPVARPAFIAVLGGPCDRASLSAWRAAFANAGMPVHLVPGDGGLGPTGDPVTAFEEQIGPAWYAFWSGGRCFVVLVGDAGLLSPSEQARQARWLHRLRGALPGKAEVVVLCDVPPAPEVLTHLDARVRLRAVLYSHWPEPGVHWLDHTALVCCGPYRSDSWGHGSGRFLRVRIGPEGVITQTVAAGVRQQLDVLAPGPLQTPDRLALPVRVAAYDSREEVQSVSARVDDGPPLPLRRAGRVTWRLDLPAVSATRLLVAARTASGTTWERQMALPAPQSAPRVDCSPAATPPRPPLVRAWLASTEAPRLLWADPVVVGGAVYVTAPADDAPSRPSLVCLDAATGQLRWRVATPGSVLREPLADSDRLYAMTATNTVLTLDAGTGRELWRSVLTPDPPARHRASLTSLSLWHNRILAQIGDGPLVALSQADGGITTQLEVSGARFGGPVVTGGHALVPTVLGLVAVNAASFEPRWETEDLALPRHGRIAVADPLALVLGPELVAVDQRGGAVRWRRTVASTGLDLGTPVVQDGVVYVPGDPPAAFRANNGTVLWSGANAHAAPRSGQVAVAGGRLWTASDNGLLGCWSLDDGHLEWSCDVGLPLKSSPVVAGNAIYLVDLDGNVHCFVNRDLR